MNDSHNYIGGTNWWAHQNITAAAPTVTVMKTVPASGGTSVATTHPGAAGTAMTYRLVITGYSISGTNTNAALCTVEVRSAGSNNVLFSFVVPATNGNVQKDNSDVWYPAVANESIDVRTSGALTGNIRVTLFGRIFPATTHLADFYDGAAH